MATPWYPSQSGMPAPAPAGNPNGWQTQWTPNMQQDAINYGASHPQWQGYNQIMSGSTPQQIMQGLAPSPGSMPGVSGAQAGATDPNGLQTIFALLQGQNAPENQAIDTLKQQLGIDVGNETKLTGLKEGDLRASTGITMARANKMIANAQAHIQNVAEQRGIVGQLYGEANKQAGLQYGQERANLLSDATARGAVNAHGTVATFQNQYGQFANQLAGNLTQKNKSMSDLALEEKDAQNTAAQYGLDKQMLTEKLNNGLQQLGIQGQIDLGSLFKQSAGLDAQKAQLAQGMISQLISLGQSNPNFLNQIPGLFGNQAPGSAPTQQFNAGAGRRVQ